MVLTSHMIFFSLKHKGQSDCTDIPYAPLSSPLPHPQPPCSDLGILHGHPTPDSRPPVHASHEISEPGESRGPRARANDTARENIRESSAKKKRKKGSGFVCSRVRVIPHYTSMAFCCQLTQIPRISPLKSLGGLDAYGPRWEPRGRRPHEADASRSRWRVGDAPTPRESPVLRFLSLSSKRRT